MLETENKDKKDAGLNIGLQGFICPASGQNVRIAHCIANCKDHCKPLPILLSLLSNRHVQDGVYHVTEILNPPRVVYLQRNFPYYSTPNNLVWMQFGTAWHKTVESSRVEIEKAGLQDDYLFEQSFKADIETKEGKAILSGRADLYIPKKHELWDFKTVKAYFVRKVKQSWDDTTYHWQLNIYKHFGFPDAKSLKIEALVKDHSEAVERKYGITPTLTIDVPMIASSEVLECVKTGIGEALLAEKSPQTIRNCTPKERWGGNRCKKYCNINNMCPQFAGDIMMENE